MHAFLLIRHHLKLPIVCISIRSILWAASNHTYINKMTQVRSLNIHIDCWIGRKLSFSPQCYLLVTAADIHANIFVKAPMICTGWFPLCSNETWPMLISKGPLCSNETRPMLISKGGVTACGTGQLTAGALHTLVSLNTAAAAGMHMHEHLF